MLVTMISVSTTFASSSIATNAGWVERPAYGTLLANPKRLRTEEGARATDGLRADGAMVKRSETPCCRGHLFTRNRRATEGIGCGAHAPTTSINCSRWRRERLASATLSAAPPANPLQRVSRFMYLFRCVFTYYLFISVFILLFIYSMYYSFIY